MKGKLAISALGEVLSCIFNREHVLGHIDESGLNDLFDSEPLLNGNVFPSIQRWNHCQMELSCRDCQMVAYTLGEGDG